MSAPIATRIAHEDRDVRVWEMVLAPGEKTGLHTHHHSYYFFVIEGSTLRVTDRDDVEVSRIVCSAGQVLRFSLEGEWLVGSNGARVPATHRAENVGSGTFREVLFETLAPAGATDG